MNIEKEIKQAETEIKKLEKELKLLEEEKVDIIARYKNATEDEKKDIEKEMQESENKFQALAENAIRLNAKIQKLKKQI